MKAHTNDFKNEIKKFGRQLDSIITYTLDDEVIGLGNENLNSITPHYEGAILKSVMKQLDIDSNVEIPIGTEINYQFGVKIANEDVEDYRDNYEYLDFGNYIVYSSEKQEDNNSWKIVCYDKMLYAMKDYENMNLTYPITIRNYIIAICNKLGLTFANTNDTFANYNREIQSELYLDSNGNSIGYTFRDVLDELAQVTASTIVINNNDELEIRYITDTQDTINEEYFKDINVNFGEQYGAVNTIVLSRSADSDSIYYPTTLPENPIEIKISDNQIMNFNDRADYLPDIYTKLNGLQYYLNDFSSTGICYYDICDRYNIQIGENTYSCVMFNDEINITQGLEENINTDMPKESVTDYTKADKTDRKINQTYIIVDKQNQAIESVVNTVGEQNNKISYVTQTVDEINQKISDIADVTVSSESDIGNVLLENINTSEPITIKVRPLNANNNISYLYPNSNLYPSSNLYSKQRKIRFIRTYVESGQTLTENIDYEIPDDLLYYDSTHYDEFYLSYDNEICQITKKCKYNADGTVGLLSQEEVNIYTYPLIPLGDGDYEIKLLGYDIGYLFVQLMASNIYTTQFATRVEMNSAINQTASAIELEVAEKLDSDEFTHAKIVAKINDDTSQVQIEADKVSLAGKSINLTSDDITINSNKFSVSKEGNITATGGTIGGFGLSSNSFVSTSSITRNYTQSDLTRIQNIIMGNTSPTSSDYEKYDLNGDNLITSLDYVRAYKIVHGDSSPTQSCDYLINSNNPVRCITITNNNTNDENVSLGLYGGYIRELSTNSINITGSLHFYPSTGNESLINMNASSGNITCVSLTQTSKEESKKNFEKYENALEEIKNTDIYRYNLKNENDNDKKHIGFVIGKEFNYSHDITGINENKEVGVDIYSMVSVLWQGVKEQQEEIEKLKNEIKSLKESD